MSNFKLGFLFLTFIALSIKGYAKDKYIYESIITQVATNVKIANSAAYTRSFSTIKGGVNYYENN